MNKRIVLTTEYELVDTKIILKCLLNGKCIATYVLNRSDFE